MEEEEEEGVEEEILREDVSTSSSSSTSSSRRRRRKAVITVYNKADLLTAEDLEALSSSITNSSSSAVLMSAKTGKGLDTLRSLLLLHLLRDTSRPFIDVVLHHAEAARLISWIYEAGIVHEQTTYPHYLRMKAQVPSSLLHLLLRLHQHGLSLAESEGEAEDFYTSSEEKEVVSTAVRILAGPRRYGLQPLEEEQEEEQQEEEEGEEEIDWKALSKGRHRARPSLRSSL
eukprot:scaffold2324_cov163-Ochromonas_danica.AAC.16